MAAVIVPTMKPLVKALMRIINESFDPLSIFEGGTDGFWGDTSDLTTLFQDDAGTTPVTTGGDPVGLRQDKSGNGNDQYQATAASRGTYETDGTYHWIALDDTDDSYLIDVPVGGWAGTYVQGTMQGVIVGEFAAPEGPYQIPTDPNYANAGTDTQLVLVNRVLAEDELEGLVEWVGQRVPVADFSGTGGMQNWFFRRTDLTHLDCSRWDTSSVSSLFVFAARCTNLTTLDVSNWDTSSVTIFQDFSSYNPNLTTLDVSNWDTSSSASFQGFVLNCSSLTTLIINGGTGSPFSDSPCTNYSSAFTNTNLNQQSYTDLVTAIEAAGTSNGTLNITGGSATTTGAAQTAVDALRARGWTVTTPDGY